MKSVQIDILKNAILAGICIGIAGLVYLSIENHIMGALLFSFGLLVIASKGYFLYTGKVGYLFPYQKGYLLMLGLTLLGNIAGIAVVANLFRLTGTLDVVNNANSLFELKISNIWYETFVLSIFCGAMVYIAVDSYNSKSADIVKVIVLMFSVMIFILLKFDHSIANMLYFFLSGSYSLKAVFYLLIMILGNATGSIMIHTLGKRKV